jgi:hypothetical protein
MDSVQTKYTDNFDRGFAGQIFNPSSIGSNQSFSYPAATDVYIGRAVASTPLVDGNNIGTGVAVTNVEGITVATQLVGVVISDKRALVDSSGNAYIAKGRMATVMRMSRQGLVYVKVAVQVNVDQSVFVAAETINDANIEIGEFTNISGVGLVDTGLRFFKGASAGNAAVIDMTNSEG